MAMNTAMKELGIDRMPVNERVELALDIWESLGVDVPCDPLSSDDEAELELRDRELDGASNPDETWEKIRARIEA